jgi:hypothetical protein
MQWRIWAPLEQRLRGMTQEKGISGPSPRLPASAASARRRSPAVMTQSKTSPVLSRRRSILGGAPRFMMTTWPCSRYPEQVREDMFMLSFRAISWMNGEHLLAPEVMPEGSSSSSLVHQGLGQFSRCFMPVEPQAPPGGSVSSSPT